MATSRSGRLCSLIPRRTPRLAAVLQREKTTPWGSPVPFRMQRVAQIEDEGSARIMIVGKKHATGGHGVFGVIARASSVDRFPPSSPRVRRKAIAGLHRSPQESRYRCLHRIGTGPGKQVVARSLRQRREVKGATDQGQSEQSTRHREPLNTNGNVSTWLESSTCPLEPDVSAKPRGPIPFSRR